MWEVEASGSRLHSKTLSPKKKAGSIAEVVEHLPSKTLNLKSRQTGRKKT
jgi:hypothetical protein